MLYFAGKRMMFFFHHFFVDRLVKAKSALKKNQAHPLSAISKSALEDAFLELQMQHQCCVHFCENADELAKIVCSFTKAVAEKPYK